MLIFVMYDISDTPTRSNFIKRLRYYGLRRIQKSVFSGMLSIDERFDLAEEFELYLSSDHDSIILIPLCENCNESIFIEGDLKLPKNEEYAIL
ncbi:CRISPR-associated endonuclease Cas2 [Methanobrevibacter wolinii]|uniref:CRISPR-associated endonuclease Cas2 n=1 Tax=Methanobrevibacter wolinii TaxID=190977 RepID=UPI000AD647F3|nr:CRISPR-associated endonuclease Cas2 [Methanobrevibacter wolinii]